MTNAKTRVARVSSAAAPSRRKQAAEQTRLRIVGAARVMFRTRGFIDATTEEIASAAGVAKGTLFLHARTKEQLLVMVYEDELAATVRRVFASPPRNLGVARALAKVLCSFFRVYEKNIPLARQFVREVMFIRREDAVDMRRVTDATLAGLRSIIDDRKKRGEIAPDVDTGLAAANSFLLYYGILTAWLCGFLADAPSRDRALAASLDLHWRGLERPHTSKRRRRRACC